MNNGGLGRVTGSSGDRGIFGMDVHVERCPSGQREQTVNLSAYAYGGSKPPLSTKEYASEGLLRE
jgi:hypothetical protein